MVFGNVVAGVGAAGALAVVALVGVPLEDADGGDPVAATRGAPSPTAQLARRHGGFLRSTLART